MKKGRNVAVLLALVASVASANPCFKLPKGFKPQAPSGSSAALVVATPTPARFLPREESRDIAAEEVGQIDEELARLLVQGLQGQGIEARAVAGGVQALVYQSGGRICAKPNEAELIKAEVSEVLKREALDSAVSVRLMVHRQQYHKVHLGQLVNREEALVAMDGTLPLLLTANGEVHVLGRDGSHLNYFLVLDSWGIKRLAGDEFKILSRSEWLAELAGQILTTLEGGPATR